MTLIVQLELPSDVAQRAQGEAQRTSRSVEDVLVGWLSRVGDFSVDALPDEDVLTLADSQMADADQSQMSELLAKQREGQLQESEKATLAALMRAYRRGLILKAQAMQTAVARGLRPALE